MDHLKYLSKTYKNLIPKLYNEYLTNITKFDRTLVRYFYYITEINERMGKGIHYYKNVKSLFIHYAQEVESGTWSLTPSALNGHFLAHFRNDVSDMYNKNFVSSIRKLNLDLEYVFFLLKKLTNFCNINL